MKRKLTNFILSLLVMPGLGQMVERRWAVGLAFLVIELVLFGWFIVVLVSFLLKVIMAYENIDTIELLREFVKSDKGRLMLPLILILINRVASGVEALFGTGSVSRD